jgi:hypothetical protein
VTVVTGVTRVRRVPVDDEVVRDGESVVLLARQVIRLSALGTTVLELCPGWVTLPEVAEGLVAQFGAPPDGSDPTPVVEAAVASLHEQGLVELG